MFNQKMYELGSKGSVIRALHEICEQKAAQGYEVYDFTIGNPSVPTPKKVTDAIARLINEEGVHSYTSSAGIEEARNMIANDLRTRFSAPASKDLIYMTCGAAAGLAITFKAILEEGDEVILCAPYFSEYPVYVENAGGKVLVAPFDEDMQVDVNALVGLLSKRTKAVLVNSPNNPSGAVYTKATLEKLSLALANHPIPVYIVSDEPYRELVYSTQFVSPASVYDKTITCYSYSKSLSLPGERIGYISVSPSIPCAKELFGAIDGAGRALGYVCAPSLFQRVVAETRGVEPDLTEYERNRDTLYKELTRIGYECVKPDGAFYVMIKSLEEDSEKFALAASRLRLFFVPLDDFGAKGFERVAYCVPPRTVERSIPVFEKLFNMYKGDGK